MQPSTKSDSSSHFSSYSLQTRKLEFAFAVLVGMGVYSTLGSSLLGASAGFDDGYSSSGEIVSMQNFMNFCKNNAKN